MPTRSQPPGPELKSERIDLEKRPPTRWRPTDDGRSLSLSHQFRERATAMAFLGIVARLAEHTKACPKIEHVLGRVELSLTTYEEGTVTEKDRLFAELLEMTLDFLEPTEDAA